MIYSNFIIRTYHTYLEHENTCMHININMKIALFIPKYIMRQQIGYVSNFLFAIFCEFDKQNELVAINVNDNSTTQALSQQQHARITT